MAAERKLMAPGSKWIVLEDFQAEDVRKLKVVYKPRSTGSGREPHVTHREFFNFKKGDILEIDGKSSNRHPEVWESGIFYDLIVTRPNAPETLTAKTPMIEFKHFAKKVDLHEAVKQIIWTLYSPSRGYVDGPPQHVYDQKTRERRAHQNKTGGLAYVDKITKAMKKKRLADAKQFLLSHSGYYNGIDTSDVYYVFEPGGEKVELPEDLVIRELDKISSEVISETPAKPYLDEMFRLRPLTQRYGSTARSVFKELEQKGQEFTTILFFRDNNEQTRYDEEKSLIIADIAATIRANKYAKGTVITKSDKLTLAVAFQDRKQAIMFRMALSDTGTVEQKMVDAETLSEVANVTTS